MFVLFFILILLFYIFAVVFLFFIVFFMDLFLEERVSRSVLLIRKAYRHARHRGSNLELAYSGGKDSDVLLELCKMADIWGRDGFRPLHRCTTIDPVGTLRHVERNGVEVLRPKQSFRQCVIKSGYPTRYVRHCCGVLKEFAVEDFVLVGIRRDESAARKGRYMEPEVCRTYNGRGKAIQYYPLLDWSASDVNDFITERGIKCHPLYYDERGVFHVERRLGCMGCPLASRRKRIAEFSLYPRMVRFYLRCGREYLQSHSSSFAARNFADEYEYFHCHLFYDGKVDNFRMDYPEGCNGSKRYLQSLFGVDNVP